MAAAAEDALAAPNFTETGIRTLEANLVVLDIATNASFAAAAYVTELACQLYRLC